MTRPTFKAFLSRETSQLPCTYFSRWFILQNSAWGVGNPTPGTLPSRAYGVCLVYILFAVFSCVTLPRDYVSKCKFECILGNLHFCKHFLS